MDNTRTQAELRRGGESRYILHMVDTSSYIEPRPRVASEFRIDSLLFLVDRKSRPSETKK